MNRISCAAAASLLASIGWSGAGFAAEPPARQPADATASSQTPTPSEQCESLRGEARKECEKTAARMQNPDGKHTKDTEQEPVPEHSSPVMATEEQKAVTEARRKGKDPQKALEKVEKKNPKPAEDPS